MQVSPPTRRARIPILPGASVLVLLALSGIASAGPASGSFATPFRTEFRFVARVSCPSAEALPRPLVSAAACGDLARVRARLQEGADVEAPDSRTFLKGRTSLHHAVQRGDLEAVKLLLAAGADANAVDAFGNSALHLLSLRARRSESDSEIARLLLGAGADGRLRNGRQRTALGELLNQSAHAVDPLHISAEPLAILLDEAEAKGPREKSAIQVAVGADSSTASQAVVTAVAMAETNESSTAPASAEASVRSAIEQWAAAWSARDVDAYLRHYRPDFKPAAGRSLDSWRAQRRERIGSASAIAVTVSDIRIRVDGERAVAQFRQDYRSDAIESVDMKTLVLVSDADGWRIAEERASR